MRRKNLNKKILIITNIIFVLLASFNLCFASNDNKILEKEYVVDYKTADDFYNSISKTIFENTVGYNLENIDRVDNFKTLTKEQEIIDTIDTNTNNLEKVISMFNETKDYEEDGYTGTLKRDNSSLKISVSNSYQEEYKVYLQKAYNNVSSNELNDIPKTIKENGTTYYLVNPVWNIAETENVSEYEVPVKYNGTMYYEGIKTKTIVTSYLATIKYTGEISKQVPDTTTFTITYKEVKEYGNTISAIIGTTGIIFFSGIIIFNIKNAKVYNLQNGEYKLIKRVHISKSKKFLDLTPTNFQTKAYKIVLSKSLYKTLKNKEIKIKYFDKKENYTITNKEFEICV